MAAPAALPMYDFPELGRHTDALWSRLRASLGELGVEADATLDRTTPPAEIWRAPTLAFAQTCGLPYVRGLRGRVTLIGTPDYGILPGRPGWYNSVVVVRDCDDRDRLAEFRGARFAFNERLSQSGLYAPMFVVGAEFGDAAFFGECFAMGSHASSALAVAEGRADIAAIDAVTWRFLRRFMPETCRLRVLTETPPAPGLPYVSGPGRDAQALAAAVEQAIAALDPADRQALGIRGLWHSRPADYDVIAARADRAEAVIAAHPGLGGDESRKA